MTFVKGGLRRAGVALAVAASLFAAPAFAAPSEREKLGEQFATVMFQIIDFQQMTVEAMKKESGLEMFDKARPGWSALFTQAMAEELAHDLPQLNRIYGEAFAKTFTEEELKIGIEVLQDPAIRATFKAGAEGKEVPPDVQPSKKSMRLIQSPAGERLFRKLANVGSLMTDVEGDVVAEVVPGAFRRFGEKAEASEQARRAAAASK